jgi:S-adenosylmethionine hydrolase
MTHITLLSDFGLHDASAGVVKGILLGVLPDAVITDLSHEVRPYRTDEAAYLLGSAYEAFGEGCVHVVLTDIYCDAVPRLILCQQGNQYFMSPDNGVVPMALGKQPDNAWLCMELTKDKRFKDWVVQMAMTIRMLATTTPDNAGLLPHTPKKIAPTAANNVDNNSNSKVIYIDHMTATRLQAMSRNGRFVLRFMNVYTLNTLSVQYNDVIPGECLCRINKNGYVEICVNQGSAAMLLGLRVGSEHNQIKYSSE